MSRQPVVQGADDNLTGVAVLLEVARHLGGEHPTACASCCSRRAPRRPTSTACSPSRGGTSASSTASGRISSASTRSARRSGCSSRARASSGCATTTRRRRTSSRARRGTRASTSAAGWLHVRDRRAHPAAAGLPRRRARLGERVARAHELPRADRHAGERRLPPLRDAVGVVLGVVDGSGRAEQAPRDWTASSGVVTSPAYAASDSARSRRRAPARGRRRAPASSSPRTRGAGARRSPARPGWRPGLAGELEVALDRLLGLRPARGEPVGDGEQRDVDLHRLGRRAGSRTGRAASSGRLCTRKPSRRWWRVSAATCRAQPLARLQPARARRARGPRPGRRGPGTATPPSSRMARVAGLAASCSSAPKRSAHRRGQVVGERLGEHGAQRVGVARRRAPGPGRARARSPAPAPRACGPDVAVVVGVLLDALERGVSGSTTPARRASASSPMPARRRVVRDQRALELVEDALAGDAGRARPRRRAPRPRWPRRSRSPARARGGRPARPAAGRPRTRRTGQRSTPRRRGPPRRRWVDEVAARERPAIALTVRSRSARSASSVPPWIGLTSTLPARSGRSDPPRAEPLDSGNTCRRRPRGSAACGGPRRRRRRRCRRRSTGRPSRRRARRRRPASRPAARRASARGRRRRAGVSHGSSAPVRAAPGSDPQVIS